MNAQGTKEARVREIEVLARVTSVPRTSIESRAEATDNLKCRHRQAAATVEETDEIIVEMVVITAIGS